MTATAGGASISVRIMDVVEPTQRLARLVLIALYPLRMLDHVTRDRRHR